MSRTRISYSDETAFTSMGDAGVASGVVNVRDYGAVGSSTNDQAAIQAAHDALPASGGQIILGSGTYNINTSGLVFTKPNIRLTGQGNATITSPNSLGGTSANQMILFDTTCVRCVCEGIKFVGISDQATGNVRYPDGTTIQLPANYNPGGSTATYNHRDGIVYNGTGSLSMTNCEVTNFPRMGVTLNSGTGRFAFTECDMHLNGLANLWAYPGLRAFGGSHGGPYGEVLTRGSVAIIGGRYRDALPVAWTSPSYGIDIGGCDFVCSGAEIANNCFTGVGNDDANGTTMIVGSSRFSFGANNSLKYFDQAYTTVTVTSGASIVTVSPWPKIFEGLGIQLPGIRWDAPTVTSRGTAPPVITITGSATKDVQLLVQCTTPGARGTWKFKYSTDNGATYLTNVTSAATVAILRSSDSASTGLTLNIANTAASLDNTWSADNTWTQTLSTNDGLGQATVAQTATASYSSTAITWVLQGGGILFSDDGPCEHIDVFDCRFDGSKTTQHQIAAVIVKGHEFDPATYGRTIESQREVSFHDNVFDTFDVDALLNLEAWQAKSIALHDNVFRNCPNSEIIVIDPQTDPFDTTPTFDKKAIAKFVSLKGNTYIDCFRNVINAAGLLEIEDETVIFTGATSIATGSFYTIGTTLGRIGRVLRNGVTSAGTPITNIFSPSPVNIPTVWSWHANDREDTLDPVTDYGSTGVNASTTSGSRVVARSGFTVSNQLLAGVMIQMPGVTWGTAETSHAWPNTYVVAVDPAVTGTNPMFVTALSADQSVGGAGVTLVKDASANTLKRRFRGRMTTVSGTLGSCTAHATTRVGDFTVDITDSVTTLCPQQIISIAGATFGGASTVEVLDVIGHEGHTGTILVAVPPDQVVTAAAVSFQAPSFALCDPVATTAALGASL